MSGWKRCDRCRRVLAADEFDGDGTTCRACLTTPVVAPKPVRAAKAGPVTTRRQAPAPPAEPTPRAPLLGTRGSGDLEVRERRARRAALDALAEMHADDFAVLLREARAGEGLRA